MIGFGKLVWIDVPTIINEHHQTKFNYFTCTQYKNKNIKIE